MFPDESLVMSRVLVIWISMLPVFAWAQSSVVGKVLTRNGLPVRDVNIWSPASQTGTTTDSAGHFELECTLPCLLEFTHVNYKKEVYQLKDNENPFIITLRNKFNNLKEVVITGKVAPGRLYSSKKGIEMIPAILGEQDILKYLATTPGIVTTNALDAGIYVRGSNSSENCFLTNDVEIANPNHLTGILSTFDPYLLNNSTVYKSGYPAVYNGYLSSYINMHPDPGNKQHYEGEINLGLVSSALKLKAPLLKGSTSYAVSVRTSYLQSIARLYNKSVKGPTGQNDIPEYAFNDVTFNMDSKISSQWRLSGFGLFTIDRLQMRLSETVHYDFKWHTVSGNIGAYYTPNSSNKLHIRLGIKNAFSEGDAQGTVPMGGGNRNYSLIGHVSYQHLFSENLQLQTGVRFEHARFETANRPEGIEDLLIRSSDKNFQIYTTHIDINYQFNKYFTLNGGLNYQFYQGDSRVHCLSPRAKLSFSTGKFTLWGDYAQTVQYLSLYPYFTVKTPIDIWYPLGKNMRPAICHQWSVGMEQEILHGLSLYAGLFYKKMRHAKDFSSGVSTKYTALSDNLIEGKGHAKGLEFNLAYTSNRLNARVNYTLSESERKFADINEGKPFNPPYDVKHNVVINSSWDFAPRFTFNALWTFSSGIHTTFPVGVTVAHNITDRTNQPILIPVYTDRYNYQLPDNHRLDLNLDYLIPYKHASLRLSAGAYNVYNKSNPSFVYFKPETGPSGETKFSPKSKVILPFIPYISLRLKF